MQMTDVLLFALAVLVCSGEEPKIIKSTIYNVPLTQTQLNQAAKLLQQEENPQTPPKYFLGEFGIKAFLGTPSQTVFLMLDSMHRYIWVSTDQCTDCINPKFHSKSSSTYHETHTPIVDISYDIADQTGYARAESAEDIFGVSGNNYFLAIKLAAVYDVVGELMNSLWVHGSLGLNYRSFKDEYGYIRQLMMQSKIDSRIAGVYLGSHRLEGELIVGGYNKDRYDKIEFYHALDYNGKWEIHIDSIKYGNVVHSVFERRAMIELQIPFIIIPYNDFQPIMDQLVNKEKRKCYSDPVTHIFWCEVKDSNLNQFSPLEMWIDSTHKFKIPPENYIQIVEEEGVLKAMFRIVLPIHSPFIGLGSPFIKSVYLVLDYDNEKVGIGIKNDPSSESSLAWLAVLIIILVLLLGAGGFLLYRKKRFGYFLKKPNPSTL